MKKTEIKKFESVKNLSKNELIALGATEAITMLESGDYDATELAVSARKAMEYLGAFVTAMESNVMDELYRNGDRQELVVLGSVLSLGSTGDRLDYSKDQTWLNLSLQIKARAELVKQASKSDVEVVDNDGVLVAKVPIKSPSRDIIKFKL